MLNQLLAPKQLSVSERDFSISPQDNIFHCFHFLFALLSKEIMCTFLFRSFNSLDVGFVLPDFLCKN